MVPLQRLALFTTVILIGLDTKNKKEKVFKDFFDGIKMGKAPEESLKDTFRLSYQELGILYAKAIGLNGLR